MNDLRDVDFEIIVDGEARPYRARPSAPIEAALFLKEREPEKEVSLRDLRDNSMTFTDWKTALRCRTAPSGLHRG
jgi:hypothetical protein